MNLYLNTNVGHPTVADVNPFLSASIILKDPGSSAQMECIEETHGESLEALCTRQGFLGWMSMMS